MILTAYATSSPLPKYPSQKNQQTVNIASINPEMRKKILDSTQPIPIDQGALGPHLLLVRERALAGSSSTTTELIT